MSAAPPIEGDTGNPHQLYSGKAGQPFIDPMTDFIPGVGAAKMGAKVAGSKVAAVVAALGGKRALPMDEASRVARAELLVGLPKAPRLMSGQRYLDADTVRKKISDGDFEVQVSPPFKYNGKDIQVVTDGHHSLEAARQAGIEPEYIVQSASENDTIGLLDRGKSGIRNFLHYHRDQGQKLREVKRPTLIGDPAKKDKTNLLGGMVPGGANLIDDAPKLPMDEAGAVRVARKLPHTVLSVRKSEYGNWEIIENGGRRMRDSAAFSSKEAAERDAMVYVNNNPPGPKNFTGTFSLEKYKPDL